MTTGLILSVGCIGGGLLALSPDIATGLWRRFHPERFHRICITDQDGNIVRSHYLSDKHAGELITHIDRNLPIYVPKSIHNVKVSS